MTTVLVSGTALTQAAEISFLTHWSPDTVAMLDAAIAKYGETHKDDTITVRAVPFGDLLTTLRTSGPQFKKSSQGRLKSDRPTLTALHADGSA